MHEARFAVMLSQTNACALRSSRSRKCKPGQKLPRTYFTPFSTLPFVCGRRGRPRLRAKACHIGKVQEARIPLDNSVGITPEHDTFEVVVEQPLGNPSQVRKRMQVTPNEPGGIR